MMNILQYEHLTEEKKINDYVGDDGLLYCGVCHEAKEELVPEEIKFRGCPDKHPRLCDCDRARFELEIQESEARRHAQETERLRRNCFTDLCQDDMTFDASSVSTRQFETCRRYTEYWDKARENNFGLLLWGDVGTGKSYLAACIANALIEKELAVRMLNFGQILNAGFEEKARILEEISSYDLLILDDFGMERNTEYGQEIVFQVIDNRYQSKKPMIITTNLSLQTLKEPRDLEHKRIYERILEVCIPVHFDGDNLREKIRLSKLDEFRKLIMGNDKVVRGDTE